MMRLALIGCGEYAEQYAGVASRLQNAKFTAIADPDLDRARQIAQALGASIFTGGFDELFTQHSDAIDAVLIHSTNRLHERHCQQAAETGKHVFVETPLTLSIPAADAVIEACQTAGVQLMVGQASRFLPAVQIVKESFETGKLGDPGLLRIHCWQSLETGDLDQPSRNAEHNGGVLFDQTLRQIDLANWLFGQLPTEIYAVGHLQSQPQLKQWDSLQVHLGFPQGGMALIDCSMTLPKGSSYRSLSMIGARGAAYADDHHNVQLLYAGGDPSALKTRQGDGHVLAQLREFVSSVEQGRDPPISGRDGRMALQVAEAAAESISAARAARLIGGRYELV